MREEADYTLDPNGSQLSIFYKDNIDADHKRWQCHVSQMFAAKCKLQMNLWAPGS